MQPQAAEAWAALRELARSVGLGFTVSSAYRSPESQRAQFLSKLTGSSEQAIDAALTWYSAPGTSKHHGGYALDFRYTDGTFGEFRRTPAYTWLAADNFAVPKTHGLIPSYPDDVADQGPNPEPWEFVWVGEGLIRCGLPQDVAVHVSGPAAAVVADIERCPGGPGPAQVPAWLTGA
jgi:LAS superfamily LD-carboxypeptidase LdcB